jgi:hypothetical protein
MTWLFAALVILLFVVLAGRAHSKYLDAQEALWRRLLLNDNVIDDYDGMIDENWENLRARRNNVRRYRRLLQTELTELERRHIERRLDEERSAMLMRIAPLHSTRDAGPRRPVREIEVIRDGAAAVGPPSSGSARR